MSDISTRVFGSLAAFVVAAGLLGAAWIVQDLFNIPDVWAIGFIVLLTVVQSDFNNFLLHDKN